MSTSKMPFELTARLAKDLRQVEVAHREGFSKEYLSEVVENCKTLKMSHAITEIYKTVKRYVVSDRTKPTAEEHVAIVILCVTYREYIKDLMKVSAI